MLAVSFSPFLRSPRRKISSAFPFSNTVCVYFFSHFVLLTFNFSLFHSILCPVWIMKHRVIFCPEVLISFFISRVSSCRHYCRETAVYILPSTELNTLQIHTQVATCILWNASLWRPVRGCGYCGAILYNFYPEMEAVSWYPLAMHRKSK